MFNIFYHYNEIIISMAIFTSQPSFQVLCSLIGLMGTLNVTRWTPRATLNFDGICWVPLWCSNFFSVTIALHAFFLLYVRKSAMEASRFQCRCEQSLIPTHSSCLF